MACDVSVMITLSCHGELSQVIHGGYVKSSRPTDNVYMTLTSILSLELCTTLRAIRLLRVRNDDRWSSQRSGKAERGAVWTTESQVRE